VSYADFITLLFAFFTTMYAISNVDVQKLSALKEAMQAAFDTMDLEPGTHAAGPAGPPAGQAPAPPPVPEPSRPARAGAPETPLEDVRQTLLARLQDAIAQEKVALEMDPRGLVVSIRETGSFATGSADLSRDAQTVVGEIARTLADIGNLIRIEGHSDDRPIHTPRFASNWELSTARATSVVAYLVEREELGPERLSAAGYAEFHPRVPNDSEENRARNRRVDVVILNPTTSQSEEPGYRGDRP
jgi:chemotaxis protein MotB